ncbi:uncharacterized protein [Argopecten irradians]|uniref:uncharacterized protein n=1 Tax=Argopecten irradians TaxID=31199 RepID=UPI003718D6AA
MINGGFGETHVSSLLAALNIPSITHRNLKSREREVGAHLQLMAEESCKKHLEEEANLTNGDLSASFDGAWQKRGAGRGYNSLTGHASLIGEKTKKCISFSVKGKYCRVCTSAKKKGVPPRKHNCCRNWTGSAKSMEPAMACEMLQGVIDKGQRVQTLVMDNDSTTIARVKATVDHSITKKSDGNHIRKGLGGSLVELSKTHKVLRNYKVRTHIERCFMYSIRQNQNNATQLAADLEKIVPHLYGEHELCGTWCKSQKTDYKPKNLPYGKPLSSTPLRCDLEVLLRKYATKANELDSLGSTQYNESFNHMVSSKAPKRLFYGGSESLKTRVSATVCQKNDGYKYISELNKRCKMSPGKYTIKFASKLMHSLQKRQKKQSQQEFKRRRLELKHERSSKDATHSVLEGDTYDSKIGLELDEGDIDIEDINISPPEKAREQPLIFIDLETTGLARTSDIVQISAICDKDRFNIYTAPTQPISLEASQATGLTYVGGILKHNGQIVQTTDIKAGLEQFVEYLQKYKDPILIGHNIQNFDVPILINQLNKYDLISKLNTSASGFIDTLKLAKRIWKKPLIKNYKQETLVNFFLGINYEAHNAMADVISLQQLFEAKMSSSCLSADIFTLCYYTCKESLDPLVKAKAISSLTMKKLVACSLNLKKLKLIHKRNPEFGISHVFTESLEGTKTPRITKSKRVIEKIVDYLNK